MGEFVPVNSTQKWAARATAAATIFIPGGGEEAAAAKLEGKVVSVYMKAITPYVGITKNIAAREIAHGERLVAIAKDLTRTEARGVEQAIIEKMGLAKNGGTLTNKINSVARGNPIYNDAATFGRRLLKSLNLL